MWTLKLTGIYPSLVQGLQEIIPKSVIEEALSLLKEGRYIFDLI